MCTKPLLSLSLPGSDRVELDRRVASHSGKARDKFRAQVILMRASGLSMRETAKTLCTSCVTVQKWVDRYCDEGLAGLDEKLGRRRKSRIPEKILARIITDNYSTHKHPNVTQWLAKHKKDKGALADYHRGNIPVDLHVQLY